jgi:hypothetical protein
MEREKVLATAGELITKDRADLYGPPEKSFGRIGALWGAMLGTDPIEPEMVALMLVQLKVSRIVSSPGHEDSWVDLCGYGALGGELATHASAAAVATEVWNLHSALSEAVETYMTEHPGMWSRTIARTVVRMAGETQNLGELENKIAGFYGEGQRVAGTPGAVLALARKLVGEQMDAAMSEVRRG